MLVPFTHLYDHNMQLIQGSIEHMYFFEGFDSICKVLLSTIEYLDITANINNNTFCLSSFCFNVVKLSK